MPLGALPSTPQKGDKFHSESDTACHNVASDRDIAVAAQPKGKVATTEQINEDPLIAVFRHLATFCQSPLPNNFCQSDPSGYEREVFGTGTRDALPRGVDGFH